jgi:hypothetical protein
LFSVFTSTNNPEYLVNLASRTISYFTVVISVTVTPGELNATQLDSLKDSTQNVKQGHHSNIRLTTRLHTRGIFGYGGMIANENPAFDLTVNYERKSWGCLFLKAIDLRDLQSPYDFSLALLYKNFHAGPRIIFTPFAGFVIEQRHHFIDHDSDGMIILLTSFKVTPKITLEHCGRFSNTFFETQYFDWLNRVRLLYSHKHLDLTASGWHNNRIFDDSGYTTLGLSAAYSRIRLSERVKLSAMVTGMVVAKNADAEPIPNGLVLTIAATAH